MNGEISRRQFAYLSGAAAAALVGAGHVSAQDSEEGVEVTKPEEGKLNVTWWSHTNTAFVAANTALIEAFEAENPDIHIVYQHFPYEVFVQKLQTGYNSGTVADMQQMFGTWVTKYAGFGLLDRMSDDLANGIKETFYPATYGAYELDGGFYGYPKEFNIEQGGMLVNPALLGDLPIGTWQEMVDSAVATTVVGDNNLLTQAGMLFLNNDTVTFSFLSMILQQGENYFAEDGVHVNYQTDAAKAAWAELTSWVTDRRIDSSQSFTGESQEVFYQGKGTMAIKGPWTISVGEQEYPDLEFEYRACPPFAGDKMIFAAESGWGEVVNAKAADDVKAAAWKFIDFMAREENARAWNIGTSTVPALKALKDDPAVLDVTPALSVSFAVLDGGQWIGNIGDRDRFFQAHTDGILRVELGQATPEESLNMLEQELNMIIDESVGP